MTDRVWGTSPPPRSTANCFRCGALVDVTPGSTATHACDGAAPLSEAAPPTDSMHGKWHTDDALPYGDPLEELGEPTTDLRASVNNLLQYVDTNEGKNGAEACINRVLAAVQFTEGEVFRLSQPARDVRELVDALLDAAKWELISPSEQRTATKKEAYRALETSVARLSRERDEVMKVVEAVQKDFLAGRFIADNTEQAYRAYVKEVSRV